MVILDTSLCAENRRFKDATHGFSASSLTSVHVEIKMEPSGHSSSESAVILAWSIATKDYYPGSSYNRLATRLRIVSLAII